MSKVNFDPEEFKINQKNSWDSVAAGWGKWWKTIENGAQTVSDKLVELAEIRAGQRVLDVATGIGEPAITAGKIVGQEGHVTATDISPEMLAIGEERARSQGLQNIMEFVQSDAENLKLRTDDKFDAILCRWGLMFLPNLDTALSNLYDKLVSGGKLAAAVWSEPSKVPFISLSMDTARKHIGALPGQGLPGPLSLADVDSLKKSFDKAGFADIRTEKIPVIFEFDTAEDYTKFNQDIVAPIRTILSKETENKKQQVWNDVTEQAKLKFSDPSSGRVKFVNEAICIVGLAK
ncbi:MAG TPA: class I SAM-dependent methyltransferase [Nitrososphaeraceae archaeon]|jgi:ubiquinone/menaquinone biosynthesis C-methylase UbiE|nr:class I SAM-dependent methyltransferase [Nitrososphaeraceae archaeon]